ncbi:hypothetical protein [Pseudoalteromonas piscicida]|uniref:hypothetical protein n=1 Tax=Pseudoalteromonas piscicida TaxID=43662 RepID=UPI0030A8E638
MSIQTGIFSFNAAQITSSTKGPYRALQPYEKPVLHPSEHGLVLLLEIPSDARMDDKIELVLTKLGERCAIYNTSVTVDPESYLTKIVEVNVTQSLEAGAYVMQLNLMGLHNFLKNSTEFEVVLSEQVVCDERSSARTYQAEPKGLKRMFTAAVSAVLSIF